MFSNAVNIIFAIPLLVAATKNDITKRIIPNNYCILLLLGSFAISANRHHLTLSLICFIIIFLALFTLWKLGILGGGDVKLICALTPAIRIENLILFLSSIAIFGGALAGIYLILKKIDYRNIQQLSAPYTVRRVLQVESWRARRHGSLPYAVAISVGYIFTVIR